MTKQNRLALIRARFAVTCGAALPGILSVSAQEICDTVAEETAPVLRETNDSTQDAEEVGFKPELETSFDRVREIQEKESETLLSQSERNQLARDLREYKKRFWLTLIPANSFAA